ncbi:MAG TPA: C4-type zinc ribbon domain-containing protein [Acidimicrobiales bacterium]
MTGFDALLEVQHHDTTIDQLRHRKEHLPERAELAAAKAQRVKVQVARDEVAARRDEVATRQAEAEREIAASEKRISEVDTRMRSGQVTASRDLQAMSTEIDHIKERISALEDSALEAMDEREPLDAEVATLDGELGALDAEVDRLTAAIAAVEAEVDDLVARERDARTAVASGLPEELASTYERLRTRLGGIGAARLDGNRCTGCHLTLPATELDRIRHTPAEQLVFCDQCGRILVRD